MTCPRELDLDRLIGGSMEGAEATELETHLASCGVCASEKERLIREADYFKRHLAPYRLHGGMKEEVMAQVEVPVTADHRPSFLASVSRWGIAAAIFVAALVVVLQSPGRPVDPPVATPTNPPGQETKTDDLRILSMGVRRSTTAWSMASQELMAEELPFVSRQLDDAGLWSLTENLKPQKANEADPARRVGLALVGERKGIREAWMFWLTVYPSQAGDWNVLVDGPRKGQAEVSKEVFDRLWAILDRAMNPLQLWPATPPEIVVDGRTRHRLQYSYRGGLEGWKARIEVTSEGKPVLFNGATFDIRRERGTPLPILAGRSDDGQVVQSSGGTLDAEDLADLGKPGRYAIRWGSGQYSSPEVEIIIPDGAAKPAAIQSMEIFRVTKGPTEGSQQLLPQEIPLVMRQLEDAGLWSLTENLKPQKANESQPGRRVGLALVDERKGIGETWTFLLTVFPSQQPEGWALLVDGPRKGQAEVSKEIFDRLWAILDRAMNPLQLYLGEPLTEAGKVVSHPAFIVCRGKVEGWTANEALLVFRYMFEGVQVESKTRLPDWLPGFGAKDGPFSVKLDLRKDAIIDRRLWTPGATSRCIWWGDEKHRSPDVMLPEIDKEYWEQRQVAGGLLPLEKALEAGRKENKPVLCYFYFDLGERRQPWREAVEEVFGLAGKDSFDGRVILADEDFLKNGDLRERYEIDQLRVGDFVLLLDPRQDVPKLQVLTHVVDLRLAGVAKGVDEGLRTWAEHDACRRTFLTFRELALRENLERLNKWIWPDPLKTIDDLGVETLNGRPILGFEGEVRNVQSLEIPEWIKKADSGVEALFKVAWVVRSDNQNLIASNRYIVRTAKGYFVVRSIEDR